jgi:hypothetical protein
LWLHRQVRPEFRAPPTTAFREPSALRDFRVSNHGLLDEAALGLGPAVLRDPSLDKASNQTAHQSSRRMLRAATYGVRERRIDQRLCKEFGRDLLRVAKSAFVPLPVVIRHDPPGLQ